MSLRRAFLVPYSLPVLVPLALMAGMTSIVAAADTPLKVEHAYARATLPGQSSSAVFMTIENETSQVISLVKARSDAAGAVEFHTHTMTDGMMRMRRVDHFELPARNRTSLQPGANHIMLIDLAQPLPEGSWISLQLVFSDNSTRDIKVPVRAVTGMAPHGHQEHEKHNHQ